MQVIPPNFISVRLSDDDKQNFSKIAEHMNRTIGIPVSAADVYRLAMKALAEKHNVKGVR